MTRETSQNADLDFEQMMGELAAMKTDLAHRQASRSGPRTTTPRTPGDGEPRRTRTRRTPAPSEPRPDLSLSVDAVPTENPLPVPAPLSPLSKQPDERDDHVNEIQSQSQNLSESRNQSQNLSESQNQSENQDHLKNLLGDTPSMAIDTANPVESRIRTVQTLDEPLTQPDQEPKGPELSGVTESPPESRRPLPPKSAQRSRSISHHSGRPSPSTHDDQAPDCSGSSAPSTPQEVMTPTFGASAPRKFLRPHPSSPSLSTSNQSPASPRLPARSNSRRQPQAILPAVAPSEAQQPFSYGGGPPPVIPPRSRSGSRSLSRNNTITRPDGDQSNPFPTTTIAEDGEPSPQTPQNSSPQQPLYQLQPQQPQPESQQPQHEPMPESETRSPSASVSGPGHARKKSSSNGLRRLNEEDENKHSLAPSLLPAEPIPSNPPSHHNFQQQQQQHQSPQYHENENAGRPTLRKQKSADPGAMYRQQEESSLTPGRLPSRHASERRPNRDKNNSSSGVSEPRDQQERGRTQSKEEGSKGGLFNWVRSRSKSKDASLARLNYDTSHPVPEQPSYTEYNPALIPSRSVSAVGGALRRDKSIPRKASNQNFHPSGDGAWPPYSPGGKSGDQDLPIQRKKSLSRPGPNGTIIPPTLHRMASNAALDGSGPGPQMSLNISTNSSTTYHENMIRGMGMGSTPITPTVLLTPQPSFPTTGTPAGNMRGMALNMMKEDDAKHHAQEQQQMQQQLERQQQLQQAQLQHLQQQQQKLAASVANSMTSPPGTPTRTAAPTGPLSPAPAPAPTVRLVATRIYIQTETDFKSVNLAPNTTALDVLHMLQQRGCFGEPGDGRYHDRWTIFEYSKEFLIERPLRDFEVVLDVIKTWEADKDNKMICKSFPARDELAAKEIVRLVGPAGQASFVRPHGWVHLETKKSKWVKRYLHATDTAVYHSKDNKFNGESMLCLLRNFDVYAVQVPRKKAPTKFGFALKSSDKIHLFETPEDDYIHYVCTDSGESLREWLVGLRASKGIHMYHANPEVIREGQKHALELQSAESEGAMNSRGNLTEEQVRSAEAKLAGWGMALNGGGSSAPR
ncbi:hypothetical protein BG005_003458 [Podila minutissima]|nr:hypothetical protein BG005_003458 [Podila minutissima]